MLEQKSKQAKEEGKEFCWTGINNGVFFDWYVKHFYPFPNIRRHKRIERFCTGHYMLLSSTSHFHQTGPQHSGMEVSTSPAQDFRSKSSLTIYQAILKPHLQTFLKSQMPSSQS